MNWQPLRQCEQVKRGDLIRFKGGQDVFTVWEAEDDDICLLHEATGRIFEVDYRALEFAIQVLNKGDVNAQEKENGETRQVVTAAVDSDSRDSVQDELRGAPAVYQGDGRVLPGALNADTQRSGGTGHAPGDLQHLPAGVTSKDIAPASKLPLRPCADCGAPAEVQHVFINAYFCQACSEKRRAPAPTQTAEEDTQLMCNLKDAASLYASHDRIRFDEWRTRNDAFIAGAKWLATQKDVAPTVCEECGGEAGKGYGLCGPEGCQNVRG